VTKLGTDRRHRRRLEQLIRERYLTGLHRNEESALEWSGLIKRLHAQAARAL
jgi:hypothetical protein